MNSVREIRSARADCTRSGNRATPTVETKSAGTAACTTTDTSADPYEFFRWKSSCGRLVVRTTWVKGVRHVVLSDDDREKRQRPHHRRKNAAAACAATVDGGFRAATKRPPLSAVPSNDNHEAAAAGVGYNEGYVERVLQWLQKPPDARQKLVSAPTPPDNGRCRRPALVKTWSIPECSPEFGDRRATATAVRVDCNTPPTCRSTAAAAARSCAKNHNHKTELHVHMPSVCPTIDGRADVSDEC